MNKHDFIAALFVLGTITTAAAAPVDKYPTPSAAPVQLTIPPGKFESVLPPGVGVKQVDVKGFRVDHTPVTNEQFARFVTQHPEWRRDRVARVFADANYLNHWTSPTDLDAQQ